MSRDGFSRVHLPEATALTAAERRRFRQVERGLRLTDPDWFAAHCPHRHRHAVLARASAAAVAFAMVVLGALTGVLPVVLCGIVIAFAAAASHVGARAPHRG
jgi:hypothetical protein